VLEQAHYAASGEVLVRSKLLVRAEAYELHIDLLGGATFKDGLGVPVKAHITKGNG
jgi:hypothetical protein